MTHTSPSTYIVWTVLSITLLCFLISHLWAFDRFRCLKWPTKNEGAFKRVMTYSYLLSVPLLVVYSTGFAFIKYNQGYVDLPGIGIIPKPSSMWPPEYQAAILPLFLVFSVAWALEIVSHLEELVFWLFLIHSADTQRSWFKTWHFAFWAVGSILALGGLPAVTFLSRSNPVLCEAYTFLAGSAGSMLLTILFMPVLILFPRFLRKVKNEGAEPSVVVRLHKFHQLNITRIIFRFLFVAPLLVLALDGVQDHHHVNENFFLTDLLTVIAGVGCVVSSMITLLIFFPRSHELEAGYRFKRSDEDEMDDAQSTYDAYPDNYTQVPPPNTFSTYSVENARNGADSFTHVDLDHTDTISNGDTRKTNSYPSVYPQHPQAAYFNRSPPDSRSASRAARPVRGGKPSNLAVVEYQDTEKGSTYAGSIAGHNKRTTQLLSQRLGGRF